MPACRTCRAVRQILRIILNILPCVEMQLFQIVDAAGGSCLFSRLAERRQKHPCQNRDDCNHDEELYQGENPYFHPAKEEYRTENREGRSRKTLEQFNIRTFEQSKEERKNKAGRELTPPE